MARIKQEVTFDEVVARGCGLDVHKKEIVATVGGTGIESETRTFQSTTRSLTKLKEWLLSQGVTHVAMESTGVYWKPVMNILEPGGFTILVVNARHIKYVPGHKTDKKDSAWICKLLRAGLLKGSFVPARDQRDLRDLTRYRRKLVQQQSAEHNRMIRIFEDANLKLSSVFSDIRGKTCTRVIDAVIAGETNPLTFAALCTHKRLKATKEEIALAVEGRFTEHHKFMIRAIRTSITNIEAEIDHLDGEIERRIQPFEAQIRQLCEIPGMDVTSANELLAEIGVNMEVFPTAEHLTSWAGLAPGNTRAQVKKKLTHHHGNKATKAIMTECAWCATGTKGTYFSARYKRIAARRGKKRALVAIAAEMLKVVYHMLKDGSAYQELGEDYMVSRRKDAQIRYHREQLNKLLGEDSPETESA